MKIKYCFLCYKGISSLRTHLKNNHKDYTVKEYYDKFLKTEEDGVCLNCKKVTPFNEYKLKYNTYCCNYCMKHSDIYKQRCANGVSKVWSLRTTKQKQEIGQKMLNTFKKNPKYKTIKRNFYKNMYKDKTDDEIKEIKKKRLNSLKTTWENRTDEENLEMQKKTRITKKKKYNDETYNNRKQAKETCLKKYDEEYWQRTKAGKTYMSNLYKNKTPQEMKTFKDAVSLGLKNMLKSDKEKWQQKRLKTVSKWSEKQRKEIQLKKKRTWSLKTPEEINKIIKKQIKNKVHKYLYKGISFHSFDEMSYYIYTIENTNSKIIRNDCDFYLTYKIDGEEKSYYPDFIVDGIYVEIKGLQFFENKNPSNKMINPYNRSEKEDKIYEAKHQCMIKNNVKIITDCEQYKKYTIDKYGYKAIIGE